MAHINVTSRFTYKKGNVDYTASPNSFTETVADAVGDGPTPGAVTATPAGVNVSLAQLTKPGRCRIRNIGANKVHYGVHDGSNFFPWGEVLPATHVDFRFSSLFGNILANTGTGDVGDVSLHLLAENQDTNVTVEAFEA